MDCEGCKSRNIRIDDIIGEYWCTDCGLVKEDKIIDYSDISYVYAGDGTSAHYATSFTMLNKGLGTPMRNLVSALTESLNSIYFGGAEGNLERSFGAALPSLQKAWDSLKLPADLKNSSAILYRKCIRKKLTKGRRVDAMALAAIYLACTRADYQHDISKPAHDLGVSVDTVHEYARVIGATKTILRKPYVREYVMMCVTELSLPSDISDKALRTASYVVDKRLELGFHPGSVAGGIVYKICAANGKSLDHAKIAAICKVTEKSVRRMVKNLDEKGI